MRILISENQYKKVLEQSMVGWGRDLPTGAASEIAKGWSDAIDPHVLMTVLQIGTAFIPLVGPFISAGIGIADAAIYYKQRDTKTAGLVGVLSILPGIGAIVSKIPGVKTLGIKGMAELAKKLSFGSKLSIEEKIVAQKIAQNKELIKKEVNIFSNNVIAKSTKSTANIVRSTVKSATPYVAAGAAYNKTYDYVQRDTPKTKSEKEGLDWGNVKSAFGSSGNHEDNLLLNKAWDEGWRLGNIVPKKYQTDLYKKNYNEEIQNIQSLNDLLAKYKEK